MSESPVNEHGCASTTDWGSLHARATAALQARYATTCVLSPRQIAQTVADVLPKSLRDRLLQCLAGLGWLCTSATIPFDVLDGPDGPPKLAGDLRELARLAIFGLPGQGVPYREKHREDIYQQLCSEIMSAAVDDVSLQSIALRAMNHPDVAADGVLAAQLRSFIAEREAALRAAMTPDEKETLKAQRSKLRGAFETPAWREFPTREELQLAFSRMQRVFDGYLAQFEEGRARQVLDRMRELRRRYPVHLAAACLQRCEEQYDQLLKRAGLYRRQIPELAARGAAAAHAGDEKTAAWVMRRLQAIHTLLPNLLPLAQLEPLQAQITHSSRVREAQELQREFLERQQQVAAKIRGLAGVIHRFHELSGKLPPAHEAYRRAEANYRWAVAEIRGMNTEWLSGLVLQLETFMDDLDDPAGQVQSQLDDFIARVRTALNRLCLEIRAWQGKRPPPAPLGGAPPPLNPM
jgi:hypothetical protein